MHLENNGMICVIYSLLLVVFPESVEQRGRGLFFRGRAIWHLDFRTEGREESMAREQDALASTER